MDPMTRVSVRDFAMFQLKLLIDGAKDGAVFAMSFVAFAIDLVFRRHGRLGQIEQMVRGGDEPPAGKNRTAPPPQTGSLPVRLV